MCLTCPFNVSAESEQAQNYGCLPTPAEIVHLSVSLNRPWGCHCCESTACAGALAKGLPSVGVPISYTAWYRGELNG